MHTEIDDKCIKLQMHDTMPDTLFAYKKKYAFIFKYITVYLQ